MTIATYPLFKAGKAKFSLRLTFLTPGLRFHHSQTHKDSAKLEEGTQMNNISKEIRAKLKGFMKTDGWSTDYARSLTKDQWTGELESRFFDDIRREITSLAVREPVRLALERHSLEALAHNEHSNWKIYNVSISGEISSFF